MGTTSEKLTYLNGTKQLLKQKINNLGGSIDDNTTFRQYANQLQNVYDNLPKTEYQEGTEINLGKTIKGKLDYENGVVGIGQSEQDGTPTPSTPIEIKSVTGNQDVVVSGINLLDTSSLAENTSLDVKTTFTNEVMKLKGKTNNAGNVLSARTTSKTLKAGSYTYKAFKLNGSAIFPDQYADFSISIRNSTASLASLSLKNINNNSIVSSDFTIETDTELYFSIYSNRVDIDTDIEIGLMIIKQTETASQFEPYITPTSYQLSLGDIELNAIGNYKDELVYDVVNDKVYKKAYFGEKTYNGSETWNTSNTNVTGEHRFTNSDISSLVEKPVNNDTPVTALCNRLSAKSSNYTFTQVQGFSVNSSGILNLFIASMKTDSTDTFKTYLGSNNMSFVYKLATPTLTELTDTTLHQQVKNWYNSKSFNGTTILESNGDLPMIIKVRGLKGE